MYLHSPTVQFKGIMSNIMTTDIWSFIQEKLWMWNDMNNILICYNNNVTGLISVLAASYVNQLHFKSASSQLNGVCTL